MVIGVGFHKTGTKTLASCLETLGFRNLSLDREPRERFPHARLVLTTRRDDATWLESLTLHVARHGWERLCGFLGLPVPDAPLPHMNRRRHSSAGVLPTY